MKRRGSPANIHGSSGSVTETGAQQGKSSSTVTIRQTEGNGQEKSSGRASAENVRKIERRSPPSFNGSSNSVDETGARRGKSSSTVTIRQTEGNSQEKSSGRARDTAARRRMSAEERKNTPPDLGDADTVFADGNTMAAYAEANGNIRRNNIEYADNAARNAAQKALHDRMVNEGKILDLTENRENVSQYFPDLRSMPKAERTGLLREKIQTLKNDLRTYLNQLKGVNFEFEINGNTIEATVYNAGIKEVLQNLTQDKAGMLSASEEIFRNAEYLYSTQDKTGNSTVTGWDYFYVPIKLGGDAVGVRIAVRNTVKPREAQIYNWGIKREGTSLDGVGHLPKGSNSADVSSDVSSTATIRQTKGNSQEKSSGRGSVEESGINNRTATEVGGADIVFADGSISALSEERKITPETSKEARCEILKDRTIRPASVEYDKLGDTVTAAIYDGLSAAQMAQAKKAIPSHCEEAWAESGRSEKQPDRISVPILQRECKRKCAASERVRRTLYDGCNDKNKGIRRRKKAPSRRNRRGHFSAIGFQYQHTGYLPGCQGRRRTISEVCTGRLSERCAECRKTESDSTTNGGGRFVQD